MSPCVRGWNGMNKIVRRPTTFKWTVNTFPVRLWAQDPNERAAHAHPPRFQVQIGGDSSRGCKSSLANAMHQERYHFTEKIPPCKKVSPMEILRSRYCRHNGKTFSPALYMYSLPTQKAKLIVSPKRERFSTIPPLFYITLRRRVFPAFASVE